MTKRYAKVSGHYAGAFTRAAAFVVDWFFIITVYGILLGVLQYFSATLFGRDINFTEGNLLWLAGFAAWAFLYLAGSLAVSGRTLGKLVMGLRVVTRAGEPLGVGRASARVLALPLSFVTFGLGFLGILLGRERRALHDVISGCAVVYDWGDRPAELPAPMTQWLERRGVPVLVDGNEPDRLPADLVDGTDAAGPHASSGRGSGCAAFRGNRLGAQRARR